MLFPPDRFLLVPWGVVPGPQPVFSRAFTPGLFYIQKRMFASKAFTFFFFFFSCRLRICL